MSSSRCAILSIFWAVLALGSPHAAAQSNDPDEQLWTQITELRSAAANVATTQPVTQIEQRQALLGNVRLYLSLYPGGTRRDQAVHLELQTLFEIGCLTRGDLEPLAQQCRAYLDTAAPSPSRDEAAYWWIVCQRARQAPAATSQPSAPLEPTDDWLLAQYREYVRQYPASRYAVRMQETLFQAAGACNDAPTMRAIVQQLTEHFPENMVTEQLAGALRLHETVGHPFPVESIAENGEVEVTRPNQQMGLIVVWSGRPAGLALARDVEAFRTRRPDVWVFGLNVDADRESFRQAVESLQAPWPQHWHELGRAGPFCRRWGIRHVPCVLVLDRQGRLVGMFGPDDWQAAAEKASPP